MRQKMSKTPKCTDLSSFYATFVKFSGDTMHQNDENIQPTTNECVVCPNICWGDKRSSVKTLPQ